MPTDWHSGACESGFSPTTRPKDGWGSSCTHAPTLGRSPRSLRLPPHHNECSASRQRVAARRNRSEPRNSLDTLCPSRGHVSTKLRCPTDRIGLISSIRKFLRTPRSRHSHYDTERALSDFNDENLITANSARKIAVIINYIQEYIFLLRL